MPGSTARALELGGITKDTPVPLPGVTYWGRDKDGNPTGVGYEVAWMPVYVKIGARQPEKMIPESQQELFQAAVEAGMTTFLNPGLVTPNLNDGERMWEDYELTMKMMADLEKKGEIQLRTFAHVFRSMALPSNSPLREPLNRVLAKIIDSDDWVELKKRYMGRID